MISNDRGLFVRGWCKLKQETQGLRRVLLVRPPLDNSKNIEKHSASVRVQIITKEEIQPRLTLQRVKICTIL